jgi:hypothetical protein
VWLGSKTRPSRVFLFLFRWLLFRVMFWSALVKWFSGDDSWRNMTALRYHFESQPLPTWTSWYAHHSPNWMLAVSCAVMFFIEFVVPLTYFMPRRTRMLGFWLTVLLQVNIMATGNYGFFNILAIVLAFSLLDDAAVSTVTARPADLPAATGAIPAVAGHADRARHLPADMDRPASIDFAGRSVGRRRSPSCAT